MAFMHEIIKIEAHESEVLCIEYSTPEAGKRTPFLPHPFSLDNDLDCGEIGSLRTAVISGLAECAVRIPLGFPNLS